MRSGTLAFAQTGELAPAAIVLILRSVLLGLLSPGSGRKCVGDVEQRADYRRFGGTKEENRSPTKNPQQPENTNTGKPGNSKYRRQSTGSGLAVLCMGVSHRFSALSGGSAPHNRNRSIALSVSASSASGSSVSRLSDSRSLLQYSPQFAQTPQPMPHQSIAGVSILAVSDHGSARHDSERSAVSRCMGSGVADQAVAINSADTELTRLTGLGKIGDQYRPFNVAQSLADKQTFIEIPASSKGISKGATDGNITAAPLQQHSLAQLSASEMSAGQMSASQITAPMLAPGVSYLIERSDRLAKLPASNIPVAQERAANRQQFVLPATNQQRFIKRLLSRLTAKVKKGWSSITDLLSMLYSVGRRLRDYARQGYLQH